MKRNRRNIWKVLNVFSVGRSKMDKGLTVVIGMSIAYVASLLGMFLAYISYKKHRKNETDTSEKETQ